MSDNLNDEKIEKLTVLEGTMKKEGIIIETDKIYKIIIVPENGTKSEQNMSELRTFVYPVDDFENKIKSSKTAYLVDSSNFWHNGVHFSAEEEVKNIYESQVVAMRLEKSYEDTYI